MENQTREAQEKRDYFIPASILISVVILSSTLIYTAGLSASDTVSEENQSLASPTEEKVLPSRGVVLPATWGDIGVQLVEAGVIDSEKLKAIYAERGNFTPEYEKLLTGKTNGKLKITEENAGYLLNLLWALGLGSKNPVLDFGEMMDPKYGGAGRFASTAGWTVAKGDAMDHYSKHSFFRLTDEQQELVDRISKGIYRPCCGNSTHFPDCNHGMAMLGLLQLMASQGVGEAEMWKAALTANSYWFPDTYLTIAAYMEKNGVDWNNVSPKEVLGADYSSSSGYARISSQVEPRNELRGGSGCGVGAVAPVKQARAQVGCGI
ncbi:MAG: hypothetical protein AAB518_00100 [Patescibacteria group bacterium]